MARTAASVAEHSACRSPNGLFSLAPGVYWRLCVQAPWHQDCEMQHIQSNSDWKPLYEAALLETDSSRLTERIILARKAILDRIEESLRQPIASEHHAMNEALRHLRRLAEMSSSSIAA